MAGYDVRTAPANRRRGALVAAALALAATLGGCSTGGDTTGSVVVDALPRTPQALRDYAALWRERYEADADDGAAAMNYARGLRALTQYAQAVAVLESAAVKRPFDMPLLGAYGKALADAGRTREAMDVLGRAHTPDKPDWSVLSAQGAVAEQLGDHAAALDYYAAALKIRPGEPAVLSNMGLSYALNRQLPEADDALRQAAASPEADMRVRQNYALVLSLEGKFKEAEAVAATDLPPADAVASVDAIRRMIASDPRWKSARHSTPAPAKR